METDTHVYIATERVRPLDGVLREWTTGGALAGSGSTKGKGKEEWISWGVRSIAVSPFLLISHKLLKLIESDSYCIPELPSPLSASLVPHDLDNIHYTSDGMAIRWIRPLDYT